MADRIKIIETDKYVEWYKNDILHRDHGPAVHIKNGPQFWYYEGRLHREDGPAILNAFGRGPKWYVHGENVQNFAEYQHLVGCNDELISYFILKYGIMHE